MGESKPNISFFKQEGMTTEEQMLWREQVANVSKTWVRLVTACNSHCVFCLDSDTPRNVYLEEEAIKAELRRGREELNAWKVILSGGEGSLHPKFAEFCRYAKEIGYGRVQTVSNGWRFADRDFYDDCVNAGLDEITFSLHGHTAELHNRLTQHKGSFRRIVKSIRRAARDPRMICSVDVVINKQNVGVLDKVVGLAIQLGVTEFDLLHVIPQADGFKNRDILFYDPKEYLPVLQKVFRLNRHPRFVVWTNRFPVAFLEGMEDLIQDPHKMMDEINGRRFHVRRYLDTGEPLHCREPERCQHCFIEPYCTTMDRVIERQNASAWDVWDVADRSHELSSLPSPLPFGIQRVGVELESMAQLPAVQARLAGAGLYLRSQDAGALADLSAPTVLVIERAEQADAWLSALPSAVEHVEIWLNQDTAPWIASHVDQLVGLGERLTLHQPTFEHMADAKRQDIRDPGAFLAKLPPLRVSGLPACNATGHALVKRRAVMPSWLFESDTGRLSIRELSQFHVIDGYRSKSSRCQDCELTDRCDGMHINMLRDQGLALLKPVQGNTAALSAVKAKHAEPLQRIATGRPVQAPAASLPGFAMPTSAPDDPLEVAGRKDRERKARRREERLAALREG